MKRLNKSVTKLKNAKIIYDYIIAVEQIIRVEGLPREEGAITFVHDLQHAHLWAKIDIQSYPNLSNFTDLKL